MAREELEKEGITGGRFVQPAANELLPSERRYRLSAVGMEPGADFPYHIGGDISRNLQDARGIITSVTLLDSNSVPLPSTGIASGTPFRIHIAAYLSAGPDLIQTWNVCFTAMERTGTIVDHLNGLDSLPAPPDNNFATTAWFNYSVAHADVATTNWPSIEINNAWGQFPIMPNRALDLVVKMWVRGDRNFLYPPVNSSWRS